MTAWKNIYFLTAGIAVCFFFNFSVAAKGGPQSALNNTRRGICTVEVPTIDLLSPETRLGATPRGNGSRPGYSKIEVCCSGWTRARHNFYLCEPICDNGCENGNCTAPNVCECRRGYVKLQSNKCIPTCPIGCLHGVCTNTGYCSCDSGYVLSTEGQYCVPHCSGGCGVGGSCVGANQCKCTPGYAIDPKTKKCGYDCPNGCGEGTCIGPNQCSCKRGYKEVSKTCVPDCPKGCRDGQCTAPNRCTCKPGWTLDLQTASLCTPHCSKQCLNADCVGPNKCACKKGYVESPGPDGDHKCVAYCPNGCPNGVCSAPNFCICNPGFIKEFKGSNVCVRRLRRSLMHFELIPEEILRGQ